MTGEGICWVEIYKIFYHQGDTRYLRHLYCTLKACGEHSVTTKGNFVEILRFKFFHDYFTFEEDDQNNKRKVLKKHFNVSVVVDLVSGDTRK